MTRTQDGLARRRSPIAALICNRTGPCHKCSKRVDDAHGLAPGARVLRAHGPSGPESGRRRRSRPDLVACRPCRRRGVLVGVVILHSVRSRLSRFDYLGGDGCRPCGRPLRPARNVGRRCRLAQRRADRDCALRARGAADLPLLPAFEDGGLYYGLAIFDHVKVALVDSIYREGLPPVSPYIAPDGKPAALFYYYGWYVLAAEIRAIFGCSGYIADVALSHVTAASSLALMCAIAYRLCGLRGDRRRRADRVGC